MPSYDVVVVGGGVAGLVAALTARSMGLRATVVTKGEGSFLLSSGCIDLLGNMPGNGAAPVQDPMEAIRSLPQHNPDHPYAKAGMESVEEAISFFRELISRTGLSYQGNARRNFRIPTAAGTVRPTALVPRNMEDGDLDPDRSGHEPENILIVGFEGYRDFYPELVAKGLSHLRPGASFRSAWLHGDHVFPPGLLNSALSASRMLDEEESVRKLLGALSGLYRGEGHIGLPALLGLRESGRCHEILSRELGTRIFEIPTLPPSVPGRRLVDALKGLVFLQGGFVEEGFPVVHAETRNGRLISIRTRNKEYAARAFILAVGTFFGMGLAADRSGICEPLLGLPVWAPFAQGSGFSKDFLSPSGHPIASAGIEIDSTFRPIQRDGRCVCENLRIAGDLLAHHNPYREKSGGGVAVVSGYVAAKMTARML